MPIVRLAVLELHEHGMPLGGLQEREGKHLERDPVVKKKPDPEEGVGDLDRRRRGRLREKIMGAQNPSCRRVGVGERRDERRSMP